jgi:hypothetical protein
MEGRHIASESHVRIQILSIPGMSPELRSDYFDAYHGELLIVGLRGSCRVEGPTSYVVLDETDEVFLSAGEPFRIVGIDPSGAAVQMIWTPGISDPCAVC